MSQSVFRVLVVVTLCGLGAGCTTAAQHEAELSGAEADRLTLAAVQREIQIGMPGARVLQKLGSPNMVSTDENRHEVWVYDRVGTEYTYSESDGGFLAVLGAAGGSVAGGVAPTYSKRAGASKRSQRTLTIIVHFDGEQRVEDFSYHASQF